MCVVIVICIIGLLIGYGIYWFLEPLRIQLNEYLYSRYTYKYYVDTDTLLVVTIVLTIVILALLLFLCLHLLGTWSRRLKRILDEAEKTLHLSVNVRRLKHDDDMYRIVMDDDRRMLHYLWFPDPIGSKELQTVTEPYDYLTSCYLIVSDDMADTNSMAKTLAGTAVGQLIGGTKGSVVGALMTTNFEDTRVVRSVTVYVNLSDPELKSLQIESFDAKRDAGKSYVTAKGMIGSAAIRSGEEVEREINEIIHSRRSNA